MPPSKPQPVSWFSCGVMLLLALGLAMFYRFPALDSRPMHTDEAILGVKFIESVKTGHFNYDPHDYHGPVLHLLARGYGWLAGWHDLDLLTDGQLRTVTVCCGLLLLLATLLIGDALGRVATSAAMLIMAVSPMMVFYSRYFIMEVPFVLWLTLLIACLWRHAQSRNFLWLLSAGVCVGLLHATKETFVINLAAIGCGYAAMSIMGLSMSERGSSSSSYSRKKGSSPLWILVVLVAVFTSVMLYSGFFRHWDDVAESVTTYANYWQRSGGAGHEKPWHYYLGLLCWQHEGYGYVWSELFIVGLAVIGALHSLLGSFRKTEHQQGFRVFLAAYALAALVAYSVLSYKTPWVILSVQHALILLAGLGLQAITEALQGRTLRVLTGLAFLAGIYHLCLQTMRTIHDGRGKISNPYMYSHTGTRALELAKQVRELSAVAGKDFALQCATRDAGWPLPWYLRDLPHCEYGTELPQTLSAPVIIADSTLAAQARSKLTPGWYDDSYNLRQSVSAVLLVEPALWQRCLAQRKGIKLPPPEPKAAPPPVAPSPATSAPAGPPPPAAPAIPAIPPAALPITQPPTTVAPPATVSPPTTTIPTLREPAAPLPAAPTTEAQR